MTTKKYHEDRTIRKIEFYLISLWVLLLMVIIITVDIPVCFSRDCGFVGTLYLLEKNIIPVVSLVVLLLGYLSYRRLNHNLQGSLRNPVTIVKVESINHEHLTFMTTCIIPLISLDLSKPRYAIVMAVLLAIIGAIYVKTNLFYANPSLALLGYHIYRVKGKFLNAEEDVVVISRQKLSTSDRIQYIVLDDKVFYARKAK